MNEADENITKEEAREETGKDLELDSTELRVLACLIEKEITTPEYYPLTLKALTAACNQKSNRDPVMFLDEAEVLDALDRLRYRHSLVWQVDQAGSRTPKYKHALLSAFSLNSQQLAIICELILRGPQTQGELRTHCARLAGFGSLAEVRQTISELEQWDGTALVTNLPPGQNRREVRYAHLLGREEEMPEGGESAPSATESIGSTQTQSRSCMDGLEQQVSTLRKEVEELRTEFHEFKKQFE